MKQYSVLLLYPDYVTDTFGHDTFYTFVEAACTSIAVQNAKIECGRLNKMPMSEIFDLHCLLVIEGHHYALNPEEGRYSPEVQTVQNHESRH